MNKTKTLTQGAMLLAIFGALVLIDRITAFWFTELVVLIAPIIIIMYSAMQTLKDGVYLAVGVIFIGFILGNFNTVYLIYVPVGIVTGIVYSIGVKKGLDKRTLLFLAIITYVIGEVIANYVIYPLIGFPIVQMIESFKLSISEAGSISGYDYNEAFANIGLNLDQMLPVIYMVSIVFTGALEGVLIHLLSLFLLKRFKIKDLGTINLLDQKPSKVVAYACFIATFGITLRTYINNETIGYILLALGMIGAVVLIYYGYIFVVLYGHIVLHKNIGGLIVIACVFIPFLVVMMVCVGFLYGAGPLRVYIENKINTVRENHE